MIKDKEVQIKRTEYLFGTTNESWVVLPYEEALHMRISYAKKLVRELTEVKARAMYEGSVSREEYMAINHRIGDVLKAIKHDEVLLEEI